MKVEAAIQFRGKAIANRAIAKVEFTPRESPLIKGGNELPP